MAPNNGYPEIREDKRGWYVLASGNGIETYFDQIDASGRGYWDLRLEGESVATVRSLDDWPSQTVHTFRDIQFEREVLV